MTDQPKIQCYAAQRDDTTDEWEIYQSRTDEMIAENLTKENAAIVVKGINGYQSIMEWAGKVAGRPVRELDWKELAEAAQALLDAEAA